MNATTADVQMAAEDIVGAIEAMAEERRADECCRADAMLQIYGMGSSSASADGSTGSSSEDMSEIDNTEGNPGVSVEDGSPCTCEMVQSVEVLPTNQTGVSYTHTFQYNTCEGYNEELTYDAGFGTTRTATITREQTCMSSVMGVEGVCVCEDIAVNYLEHNSYGQSIIRAFTANTCEGSAGSIEYVRYNGNLVGFCNGSDPADTSVYAAPDLTSNVLLAVDGVTPAVCPPLLAGQQTIDDGNGNLFYEAIAAAVPGIPISCPPATGPEPSLDCVQPCDAFGQPLYNGDGSAICCEPKDGQDLLVPYRNLCGQAVYFSNDPSLPDAYTFDEDTGIYQPEFCGFDPKAQLPINGPGNQGAAPAGAGAGQMFGAYVYVCEDPSSGGDDGGGLLGSLFGDLFPIFNKPTIDCGNPQSLTESYTNQWCQYLKCQAAYQDWMTGVLGVQVAASIYYAVQAQICLNEILDDQKTISSIAVEDIKDLRQCSFQLMGQQDGLIKKCTETLMADYVDRVGIVNYTSQAICDHGENIWDCYFNLYKPYNVQTVPGLYDALSDMITDGAMTAENTAQWAQVLDDTFVECFLPEMKREFLCILDSANDPAVNINNWRREKREQALALNDHYKRTYQCGEDTMIPAIMRMSQCMVEKVCEMRDYLKSCGEQDICDWNQHYRDGEMDLARSSYALANRGFYSVAASLDWLDRNINAFQELARCYETGEVQLSQQIHDQANRLAPEICDVYNQFQEQRVEYREFWENCYKDRECRLVKQQLDLACRLTESIELSIERLVAQAKDGAKNYKEWYNTAEQHAAPKVIWAGNRAIDPMENMSDLFEEQTEKFRDIWECRILPCDMEDLEKHCDIWAESNPLLEIDETNHDVKELMIRSQAAYERSLEEALCILDEINDQETFDYCTEEQALLHVRAQFDKAEEELIRCNSRYCGGFMAEALVRLKTDRAKAEGGAFEAANRWKWWANEQIKRRRFSQQSELLQVMSGYGSQALQAAQINQSGNEQLLATLNRSISRVYTYLDHMDSAGSRTESINAQLLQNMQQMIQHGHFWPTFAVNTEAQADQLKQGITANALNIMEQGHFYLERETWATLNGSNFLNEVLQMGNATTQLGRYWTDRATQANAERAQEGRASVGIGQQAVQAGQTLHRMGVEKVSGALSASLQAASPGLQAAEIGQRYSAKSLDSQSECIDNALQHMTLAGALIDSGINFMGEVRDSYANSNLNGVYAQGNLISLLGESRQVGNQALAFREACYQQNQEMLWKSKEFLQENLRITQNGIHGSDLRSLNGLSNQLQNTLNSSLGDIFAGLTALGGNNITPPPIGIPSVGGF